MLLASLGAFFLRRLSGSFATHAVAALLTIGCAGCLILGVLPWFKIEKLLIKPPPISRLQGTEAVWPWDREARQSWLGEAVVCSRVNCNDLDPTAPIRYQARLEASFAFVLLTTITLLILSLGFITKWWTEPSTSRGARGIILSAEVVLLLLNCAGVAFVYARTKLDLGLPEGQIIVQAERDFFDDMDSSAKPIGFTLVGGDSTPHEKRLPGVESLKMEPEGREQLSNTNTNEKSGSRQLIYRRFHVFILSQSDAYWTLYNEDSDEIWLMPSPPLRSVRISTVRITRDGDILRARFASKNFTEEFLKPLKPLKDSSPNLLSPAPSATQ